MAHTTSQRLCGKLPNELLDQVANEVLTDLSNPTIYVPLRNPSLRTAHEDGDPEKAVQTAYAFLNSSQAMRQEYQARFYSKNTFRIITHDLRDTRVLKDGLGEGLHHIRSVVLEPPAPFAVHRGFEARPELGSDPQTVSRFISMSTHGMLEYLHACTNAVKLLGRDISCSIELTIHWQWWDRPYGQHLEDLNKHPECFNPIRLSIPLAPVASARATKAAMVRAVSDAHFAALSNKNNKEVYSVEQYDDDRWEIMIVLESLFCELETNGILDQEGDFMGLILDPVVYGLSDDRIKEAIRCRDED